MSVEPITTVQEDFKGTPFSFENKLKLDKIIADKFSIYFGDVHASQRLDLYNFIKNNISGENKEYFISKLLEDEKRKQGYFDIILEFTEVKAKALKGGE